MMSTPKFWGVYMDNDDDFGAENSIQQYDMMQPTSTQSRDLVLSAPKDKVKGWEPLTIQPINAIFDNGWISLGPPCLEVSEQFPELNAMRRPQRNSVPNLRWTLRYNFLGQFSSKVGLCPMLKLLPFVWFEPHGICVFFSKSWGLGSCEIQQQAKHRGKMSPTDERRAQEKNC